MSLTRGVFLVSLDFELYWGVRDKRSIEQYRTNLLGVRNAVAEILKLFDAEGVHATWATVGFLFFRDPYELRENLPRLFPSYSNGHLSPYEYILKSIDLDPECHFAPELIDLIARGSGQEIGTHTFSHYYCLEIGQSLEQFREDILAAFKVAQSRGIAIESLVFPRNQWNWSYLDSLADMGVLCYRGTESGWMYKASGDEQQTKLRRAIRLVDAYVNLSGHHTYDLTFDAKSKPFDFPSSRFLRPYARNLAWLDGLRLRRIKRAMSYAAARNEIFHLWWHPHNFGVNTRENMDFLSEIVGHYRTLSESHGMVSMNMGELGRLAEAAHG